MWSQVLDRNSRRGMSALDSAQVIRCGNTLPKWIADTSKNQPSNPNNSPRQPNFAIGSIWMGITVTAAARRPRGAPPTYPLERINAVITEALKDGVDDTREAFV